MIVMRYSETSDSFEFAKEMNPDTPGSTFSPKAMVWQDISADYLFIGTSDPVTTFKIDDDGDLTMVREL
jgi:hypothetical protein